MPLDSRSGRTFSVLLLLALVCCSAAPARAHFLFIRIGDFAEAGRSAEVYFSEQARAGDPRFIPKIAHTRLWVQTKPGEFHEIKVQAGSDRLRAMLPADESLGIVGECRYGVLARPKQTPFLLRHYPKAVTGDAEEINRLARRAETPFEIMATIGKRLATGGFAAEQSRLRLVALRDGKPMPGAVFHAVDTDLVEVKFNANSDGSASWIPPSAGRYCFYVADTRKESGELDGKHYDEVRDFATLTLNWPAGHGKPEPEAAALFKKAVANRAQWNAFPGFRAHLDGELDGRAFSGKLTVASTGEVDLKVDDDAAKPWLREQFRSLVMHRLPTSSDSETSFRFGLDDEDHPLGRLLLVNGGRMASSYRIKDGQIRVVNRDLGEKAMTLIVLANVTNAEKLSLPGHYLIHYWDGETGRITRSETVQDQWIRVASWDLPQSHTVSTASDGGLSVRTVTLSGQELLNKP